MKRFKFTLDAILKLRAAQEESAQMEYGAALRGLAAAAAKLRATMDELQACWQDLRAGALAGCPAWRLEQVRGYAATLEQRKAQLVMARKRAEEAVEGARSRLKAARQKREILERLRDRRRSLHQAEVSREEQKQADDRVAAAFGRVDPILFN